MLATPLNESPRRDGSKQRALLVVGPHRSGTSALTRTLNLMGATLPADLLQPVEGNNERGFWEPRPVVELQDEILASAGSSWDDVSAFPREWFRSDVAAGFADRLAKILKELYGEAPLIAVKDPRLCQLLPLWHDVLARLGIEPLHVLPIRHPLEVARSLQARDGFSQPKALLLWLRNTLDAFGHTKGLRRSIVTYEALLTDWSAVVAKVARELDVVWPRASSLARAQVDEFLTKGLRHHHYVANDAAALHPWFRDAYEAAGRLASGDEGAERDINVVRGAVERCDAVYARALALADQRLAMAEQHLDELWAASGLSRREIDQLKGDHHRVKARIAALEKENQHTSVELETLKTRSDAAARELEQLNLEKQEALGQIERLLSSSQEATQRTEQLEWEKRQALAEVARLLAVSQAATARANQEAKRLKRESQEALDEVARLKSARHAANELAKHESQQLAVAHQRHAALSSEIEALRAELGQRKEELMTANVQLKAVYSSSSWKITRPLRGLARVSGLAKVKSTGGRRRGLGRVQRPTGESDALPVATALPTKTLGDAEQAVAQSKPVTGPATDLPPGRTSDFEPVPALPPLTALEQPVEPSHETEDSEGGRLDLSENWAELFSPVPPRSSRRRVLIIDWRVPSPDVDSGSYRMTKIIEYLCRQGLDVVFIAENQAHRVSVEISEQRGRHYAKALLGAGVTAVVEGKDAALKHLEGHGYGYDTVIISRPMVAARYMAPVRAYCPRAKVVFDTVDLHWVRHLRGAEVAASQEAKDENLTKAYETKPFELSAARAADLTLAITTDERDILLAESRGLAVDVLPNIHEVNREVRPFAERTGLMFIGGFAHVPNVEAVEYFVEKIFPAIQRQLPDVCFTIIGSGMPEQIKNLATKQINAVGFVPHAEPYFSQARVFVAPLLHGAGMKGKVGQSLSLGLPVVTTTIGAEGIGLTDGVDAFISDDPDEFAEKVLRLYDDEPLWGQFSAGGQALIDARFSAHAVNATLERVVSVDA